MFGIILPIVSLLLACDSDSGVKAFNAEPAAEITSHTDAAEVLEGYAERFRGSVTDPDHSAGDLVAIWYLGTEEVCAAAAPAEDGTTSCDILIAADAGEVALEVRDPQGAAGSDILPITVTPTVSPEALIFTPDEVDGVYYSDQLITFTGILSDGEDTPDTLIATWKSNLDGVLEAEAIPNADGEIRGYGNLTEGQHAVELNVEDTTGKTGTASVIIDVGPPNSAPTCAITAPIDGYAEAQGEEILFEGVVDDVDVAEDWLSVVWESDIEATLRESTPSSDGSVGFSYGDLSVATHRVTMTVTDEVGETCTDAIYVTVGTLPTLVVSTPSSGDVENDGEAVSFTGTATDNEDLPTDLSLSWNSDIDGEFSAQGPDSTGTIDLSIDSLTTGEHTLTVRATDTDGLYAESVIGLTINALPTAPTVSITPDPPQTGDDLLASATGSVDPDSSGTVTYGYAWFENGSLSGASSTATFPTASTTKDVTYKLVVTPSDDNGDGESTEAEVTVINTDPVLTGPALDAATAVVGETLTCSATATDADAADTLTITYTWQDGSKGDTYTADADDDPGDTITCTATVDDGDGGTNTGSDSATIDNTDPVMGTVSVSPSSGKVGDTLTCSASATDADGDSPDIAYLWQDGSTDAAYIIVESDDPGDTLTCSVTATDDDGGSDSGSGTATVDNTDPVLGMVSITPSSADNDETLICSSSGTDADGETPSITYSWSNTTTGDSLGGGSSVNLATTSAASADTIACTALATDLNSGTDTGTASITLDNRAPSVSVLLTPDPATRYDTLSCTATASDDDDDTLATTFSWTVEGSPETATSTSGLTSTLAGLFLGGEEVVCLVAVDDGKSGGSASASASVTITNQAPTISDVTLSPDPAYTNDTLTVSATIDDDDGDALSTTYGWYVGGSLVQFGSDSTLAGASWFDKDDAVYVVITVDDEVAEASETSSSVTISNSPPGAPTISIDPGDPEVGDVLTCIVDFDSSDDDGDEVSYTVTWTVDGIDYEAGGGSGMDSGDPGWSGPTTTTWSGDTVSQDDALADEVWACTVTASDDDEEGGSATTSVVVTEREPVTVALSDADYTITGEYQTQYLGYRVASAGDVDGDGVIDILVSAHGYSGGKGAVLLFLGSSLGTTASLGLSDADYIFVGESPEDYVGHGVAGAGDVDGDGLDDILMGASLNDDGGDRAGKAYLMLGSSLGTDSTIDLSNADYSFAGENLDDFLGKNVSWAGDVDGDGLDDILLAAPGNDDGGTSAGKVYLILASSLGTDSAFDLANADYSFVGENTTSDQAGGSLAGAGDVDGDGLDDILIGAAGNDEGAGSEGGSDSGKVYVVLASSLVAGSLDLEDADYSFLGEMPGDAAGSIVSGAGDVDGDGLDDILIGAPFNDEVDDKSGKAYLILASSLDPLGPTDLEDADYGFLGEVEDDYAGRALAGAGDVDGDGLDDILIGAPHTNNLGTGQAYLLLGSSIGASTTIDLTSADYTFTGEGGDDRAGIGVAGAGDVNGDGLDDILVGAFANDDGGTTAGKAYLLLGGF